MESEECIEITVKVVTPSGERKQVTLAVPLETDHPIDGPVYLSAERCVELHHAVADAVHWIIRSGVTGGDEPHDELASIVASIMCQDGAEETTNKAWPLIAERMSEERVWPKVEMP